MTNENLTANQARLVDAALGALVQTCMGAGVPDEQLRERLRQHLWTPRLDILTQVAAALTPQLREALCWYWLEKVLNLKKGDLITGQRIGKGNWHSRLDEFDLVQADSGVWMMSFGGPFIDEARNDATGLGYIMVACHERVQPALNPEMVQARLAKRDEQYA